MNIPNIEVIAKKFTFYYKYLKYKNIFNLGIKTVLYLKYNRINGLVRVYNAGKAEQPTYARTANAANKRLVWHVRLRCGSLSITRPVSHLANGFDVRSVLHGQVSLAAVNQICVNHEAMNGCNNLKIHSKMFGLRLYCSHVTKLWFLARRNILNGIGNFIIMDL